MVSTCLTVGNKIISDQWVLDSIHFQTWNIENPGMAGYMCFSSGKLHTKN